MFRLKWSILFLIVGTNKIDLKVMTENRNIFVMGQVKQLCWNKIKTTLDYLVSCFKFIIHLKQSEFP